MCTPARSICEGEERSCGGEERSCDGEERRVCEQEERSKRTATHPNLPSVDTKESMTGSPSRTTSPRLTITESTQVLSMARVTPALIGRLPTWIRRACRVKREMEGERKTEEQKKRKQWRGSPDRRRRRRRRVHDFKSESASQSRKKEKQPA